MAAGHAAAERSALADEMLLADELREGARAHPGRQRLALGRWLEERFGSGADGPSGGWHERMVARRAMSPSPRDGSLRADPSPGCARAPTCPGGSVPASRRRSAIRRTSRATYWYSSAVEMVRFETGLAVSAGRVAPGTLLGVLGLALLGDDRGLENGGARLFLVGQVVGEWFGRGDWGRRGRRAGRRLGLPCAAGVGAVRVWTCCLGLAWPCLRRSPTGRIDVGDATAHPGSADGRG